MEQSQAARELPRYRSHKEVWALKIKSIIFHADFTATITPVEPDYADFVVSGDYVRKHAPGVGGYYVKYKDGYESWSPAEAFEGGYTLIS